MKKLSLAIDSPVESNHRGGTGRDNIPPQQRPKDLYDINDDDIGDDDDAALIDQANFQIDGGNFFGGPSAQASGLSKKPAAAAGGRAAASNGSMGGAGPNPPA